MKTEETTITQKHEEFTYVLSKEKPFGVKLSSWNWYYNPKNSEGVVEIYLAPKKETEDCFYILSTDDGEVVGLLEKGIKNRSKK